MSVYQSDNLNELAPALAKAQAAIKPAVKNAMNPHFRNNYADLPAVWESCRAALTANGLSVVQMPIDAGEGRIGMSTMLLHTSGQFIRSDVSTRITKDDPQGVGSAITYLRRYALSAMVGVVADEDDDGNAASQAPQQQQQVQRAASNGHTNSNGAASTGLATDKQLGMIRGLMKQNNWDAAGVLEWAQGFGVTASDLDKLSRSQASTLIEELQKATAE